MKVWYLPIEPYEERYTRQLLDWTFAAFRRHGVDTYAVYGDYPTDVGMRTLAIQESLPLAPHDRSIWALTQTAELIRAFKAGHVASDDVIYLQDMFHPGYSALPYVMALTGVRPRVYVQNCAQSIDVYDFTYPLRAWMRPYEQMVAQTATGIFVASSIHKELMQVAGQDSAPIHVVGLPFDSAEVKRTLGPVSGVIERRVLFTSRFDAEKQPHVYLDLVERAHALGGSWSDVAFAVSTSAATLKSNDPSAILRARRLQERGVLTIHEGLSKRDYYQLLATSSAHVNCALQDFWSNTLNEAATFGVPTVAPCFRAFPEAIRNPDQLYVPFDLDDALATLAPFVGLVDDAALVDRALANCRRIVDEADRTLDTVCAVLLGTPDARFDPLLLSAAHG